MAVKVLQRYLLQATSIVVTVPAASEGGPFTAFTANVPLGHSWTIRLRNQQGFVTVQDNSGQITVQSIDVRWELLDANGNILFALSSSATISYLPYTAAAVNLQPISLVGDPNQTVSSLDQLGGTAVAVRVASTAIAKNNDAANPHNLTISVRGILEFEAPGSSE